jgi:hypothetical protein
MRFVPTWRVFRRMQLSALIAACLIYLAAGAHAWAVLPGSEQLKAERIILFPGLFAIVSLALPLTLPPVRRWLSGHVWTSYRWGFGQTPVSVLSGLGVLAALALFIYWQTAQAASGAGRYPGGVFSGYAAGIGILLAQLLIGRRLEQDPALGQLIRDPG